jgi:hypothetical protein
MNIDTLEKTIAEKKAMYDGSDDSLSREIVALQKQLQAAYVEGCTPDEDGSMPLGCKVCLGQLHRAKKPIMGYEIGLGKGMRVRELLREDAVRRWNDRDFDDESK